MLLSTYFTELKHDMGDYSLQAGYYLKNMKKIGKTQVLNKKPAERGLEVDREITAHISVCGIRRKGEIVFERAITQQRTPQKNRSKARCLKAVFLQHKYIPETFIPSQIVVLMRKFLVSKTLRLNSHIMFSILTKISQNNIIGSHTKQTKADNKK